MKNLRYQKSSRDEVCKTDSFHTCTTADVSFDTFFL